MTTDDVPVDLPSALAAIHPCIRLLVVRDHYEPSWATARIAARELVNDLDIAWELSRSGPSYTVGHLTRAERRIFDVADALRRDDVTAELDRLLEPAIEIARSLDLEPRSVFFPVIRVLPALDGTATDVLRAARDVQESVGRALTLDRDVAGAIATAVVRARRLGRLLADTVRALSDFAGSDLTGADLSTTTLDGVRWSRRTTWPAGRLREIERGSVEECAGIYVVRQRGSARGLTGTAQGSRSPWTVGHDEANLIAGLWATAGGNPEYPLVGSVAAEFDLGYVLGEQLPEEYLPLSYPRWAVIDRVTGDLEIWRSDIQDRLTADIVVERFRAWRATRSAAPRTWGHAILDPFAIPTHVTYLRLPRLEPAVPDRWVRAYGVDSDIAPAHHPLVRQFLDSLPEDVRSDNCSEAAALSDALYVEDTDREALGQPPLTLTQARNRIFANAASLTFLFGGPFGPVPEAAVSRCRSCDLLIEHFSYETSSPSYVDRLFDDVQRLSERNALRGDGTVEPAELDEVISVLRRVRQYGPEQQVRDAGTERLFAALLQRFEQEGSLDDLDDVIELNAADIQRIRQQGVRKAPIMEAPGARWVERALRRRAEITGSSGDAVSAYLLRRYEPDESGKPAFDHDRTHHPDGYTIRATRERSGPGSDDDLVTAAHAKVARLRAQPDMSTRVDLLDELVDALGGIAIATGSVEASDELIDGCEMLIAAIPRDDVHHRVVHQVMLGVELCHRHRDLGGGPESARRGLTHLDEASDASILETRLRIEAAHVAARTAQSLDERTTAARLYRRAVDLLPRLVPRSLRSSEHARLLAPMAGLVSEAAAGVLTSGDPAGALELLEQGRGLLIGRALDAHDGTSAEIRRIADELATSPDPHADREPGEPSLFDRRRQLEREWDREVIRIRRTSGSEDYLSPPRVDDLTPLAEDGPVVTIVVGDDGAHALLLTTNGVDVVHLPELNAEGLNDMVETFWGCLPFAELMPDDEGATVEAQEPLRAVLARLWDTTAAPVIDRLGATERVWWVPTGLLAALPLHAAGDSTDSVLDRVVSSYTPTIRVLRASRSAAQRGGDTACLVAMAETPGMSALLRTRREALQVMHRFPGAVRLDGLTATRQAVREAIARGGWLHLACHATSNVPDPANSALHVHGGVVTAQEVMSRRSSNGRLAYLSACSTAMMDRADIADEMIHLGAAFQIAGFRHVIGTLWSVKDSVAAATASLFYEQVGSSEDNAPMALHRAVAERRRRYPLMPTRWAPFVHLGG